MYIVYIILYTLYTYIYIHTIYTYDVTWHLEIHQPFFSLNATRTGFLRNMVGFVEELPATGPTGRWAPSYGNVGDGTSRKPWEKMGNSWEHMGPYGKIGATHVNSEECGYGKIREHPCLKMGKCWFQRCSKSCPKMGHWDTPKIWWWVNI